MNILKDYIIGSYIFKKEVLHNFFLKVIAITIVLILSKIRFIIMIIALSK